MNKERLFAISYYTFSSYDYETSWCSDCPLWQRGDYYKVELADWNGEESDPELVPSNTCCKDDFANWYEERNCLEMAPSEEVIHARLKGRRTPDADYFGLTVEEVPWRMWQAWKRRADAWSGLSPARLGDQYGFPVLQGKDYIPYEWEQALVEKGYLGF